GFHHLKMRLTREVAEEQQQDVQVSNDISLEDIPQTLQNILANKVAELTQTVAMMNVDHLRAILKKIRSARMVQLAAVGNTIPVAMDGAFKFNQIGIPAVSGTILETQMAYAFNLGSEDVVLIISNSGHSRRLLKLAEGAKENGAAVIAITNNPDSPVARVSDYHITTATREKLLMEEFCFSRVASVAVMEMLYLLLSAGGKSSYDSIRRHEEAISDDKL
ncbi:MAG: MurR/RpiR family transcriptional regulator, partial [Hungatella sp.]